MAKITIKLKDVNLARAAVGLPREDGETDEEVVANYLVSIVAERAVTAKRDEVIADSEAAITAISEDIKIEETK